MSRIGKKPIQLPDKVKSRVEGSRVYFEGPKGKLAIDIPQGVDVAENGGVIAVKPTIDDRQSRALQGLTRALLSNAAVGVSQGYTRILEINGVGYRAEAKGKQVHFTLGYSHPIVYDVPEGLTIKTPAPNRVVVEGADKQMVGMAAADIRMLRPPEPYKAKGIKYEDELIRRKVGKTGA